ncbi:MAG: hypothetical protein AAF701_07780 [Pseudomonadota bacterium]
MRKFWLFCLCVPHMAVATPAPARIMQAVTGEYLITRLRNALPHTPDLIFDQIKSDCAFTNQFAMAKTMDWRFYQVKCGHDDADSNQAIFFLPISNSTWEKLQ